MNTEVIYLNKLHKQIRCTSTKVRFDWILLTIMTVFKIVKILTLITYRTKHMLSIILNNTFDLNPVDFIYKVGVNKVQFFWLPIYKQECNKYSKEWFLADKEKKAPSFQLGKVFWWGGGVECPIWLKCYSRVFLY